MKRLVLTGSTLRAMPAEEKAASFQSIREHIMPLVDRGDIAPVIHAVHPLADALDAHELMMSGSHTGKIILDCRIG